MRTHDLADFRTWGYDTRGWAHSTRTDYTSRLLRAHRWLKANRTVPLPRASTDSLVAYLGSLPPSPSTRNGCRDALAAYYDHLKQQRRRRDNPATGLPRLREPRTVPRSLNERDVRLILDVAATRGAKWNLVLTLLLSTGLRASEACNLQWPDVQTPWLTVANGKGGHQRMLPLPSTVAGVLDSWRDECPSPEWVLPGRWPDRPLSYQGLYYGVCKVGEAAGIDLHPHLCRSTYATSLLDAGADVRTVQGLLGHATLATTSRYLAARDSLAVEAVGRLPWAA